MSWGAYALLRPLGATHPRVVSTGASAGAAILKTLRAELIRQGVDFIHPARGSSAACAAGHRRLGPLPGIRTARVSCILRPERLFWLVAAFRASIPFPPIPLISAATASPWLMKPALILVDLEFVQFETQRRGVSA